jgi:hypothetical protein
LGRVAGLRDQWLAQRVDTSSVRVFALRLCGLLVALCLALSAATASAGSHRSLGSRQAELLLAARARTNLHLFTSWLAAGHAKGFIGEVGWPGNPEASGDLRWNAVARAWYKQAASDGLTVAAWATGEMWAKTYKLAIYRSATQFSPVDLANPQAAVIEGQPAALRGINIDGGAFGEYGTGFDPVAATSPLDNVNVGVYGRDYGYPSAATFSYLARRGATLVRLAFRWERLQRAPASPLDLDELARLRTSVDAAGRAGLRVILDCHNYGAYYLRDGSMGRRRAIGSRDLTVRDFADLWRRLARAFRGNRVILGYGLMNEPTGMNSARKWEIASQAGVNAIREAHDRHRIYAAAYGWSNVAAFQENHSHGPWIRDPARNTWYEAHQYFDRDMSSHYRLSFDDEARTTVGAASR